MTNPIQGMGSAARMPQAGQARMNESQKSSFQEIMSRYDSENFTKTDFEAMGNEFRQAGIGRTSEVKSMLEDAGFNIDNFSKGGPGGMGGPSSIQGGFNMSALQSLQEILSGYDLSNLSSDDENNLLSQLTNSGLFQTGLIVNVMS